MWVLPFLYYYHQYPLTTFYQEWGAMLLGLLAGIFMLGKRFWQQPEVPRIVLLPAALIAVILLQLALGRIVYFDQALLFVLYMLWIMLLMILGRALRDRFGMAGMAHMLAIFLLAGSEVSALAGVLQHYRWHTFLDPYITAQNNVAVYGNLAQPNHFADYITLGLISLGLLQRHLRIWQLVLLALPLLFVMVLSGSRSSWLYLLAITLLSYIWRRKDDSCKGLPGYAMLLLAGFGLMHWLVQLPGLTGATGSVTTVQRMMAGETSGSIRLYLWKESWLIFSQFPLLGAGWGQFAWQHFLLGPELHDVHVNGLYNNAHNLLIHFAVETGLAGVLALVVNLAAWLWHGVRGQKDRAYWWGYAVLAVLGIHSMLEYPLWYAYFIGIAALLLGALDSRVYRLRLRTVGRLAWVTIAMLGLMMLIQVQHGYHKLEKLVILSSHAKPGEASYSQVREGLLEVRATPLLQPYAELFLNSYLQIDAGGLPEKIQWNDRVVRFIPINTTGYIGSLLLALAGRMDEAQRRMVCTIWAFPQDFPFYRSELQRLAQKDPDHFAGLLKFAIQKQEEYESAVSVK